MMSQVNPTGIESQFLHSALGEVLGRRRRGQNVRHHHVPQGSADTQSPQQQGACIQRSKNLRECDDHVMHQG